MFLAFAMVLFRSCSIKVFIMRQTRVTKTTISLAYYRSLLPSILDSMPILKVDLGFAISASDSGADQTYENMKDVMKYIVDTYGLVSIRYGIIMFGDSANTYIPFTQTFPDKTALTTLLDSYPPLRGGPDLRKALEEARKMFDKATARPDAKKVLAVIIDNKCINNCSEIKEAAKVLEEEDVQVVPVGVGPNVDDEELETITSNKQNIIKTDKDGDPSSVGEEIIQKIRQGKNFVFIFFCKG